MDEDQYCAYRRKYAALSGELYFLEHGGNILHFAKWWEINKNNSRWTHELDAIDGFLRLPQELQNFTPVSVVVVSINEESTSIWNWNRLTSVVAGTAQTAIDTNENAQAAVTAQYAIGANENGDHHSGTDGNNENEHDVSDQIDSIANDVSIVQDENTKNTGQLDRSKRKKNGKELRRCSAQGCTNTNTSDKTFHGFPNIWKQKNILNEDNVKRCKSWVQNCGNKDLLDLPTSKLFKNKFLCTDHFSDDSYYSSDRKMLHPRAVPSNFNCTQLSEQDMASFPIYTAEELLFMGNQLHNHYDKHCQRFENSMKDLDLRKCPRCKQASLQSKALKFKCIHGKNCKIMYSHENNMDPGDIPEELKDLTHIEEQLIARTHTQLSVHSIRGQQLQYSGNVINFPQNVSSFAKTLPHRIEDLPAIIIVRTTNEIRHTDFRVRSQKIKNALNFLKLNHKFYEDVEVSDDNLANLPEDDNIFDRLKKIDRTVGEPDSNETNIQQNNEDSSTENDPEHMDSNEITDSYVPQIDSHSQDEHLQNVFDWPTIDSSPINEFKTPGYITTAFPTLFPYGLGDLNDEHRNHKVKPINYFRHFLRFEDQRFAKHPTFRFFALNSIMRWDALSDGNVFLKRHSELANLNAEELKQKIENNPKLKCELMFQGKNVRGSKPFWKTRQKELTAMIEQLNLPTLFITLSAADLHWPDLYRILEPNKNLHDLTEFERRKLLKDNPIIVDTFFSKRVDEFFEKILIPVFHVKDYWYRVEYQHRGSPHVHGVLWVENAPDVTKLKDISSPFAVEVVQFFDKLINTTHPDTDAVIAPIHPCRKRFDEIEDPHTDLAELINKVQIHSRCNKSYCLRKKRKDPSGNLKCRFGYPMDLCEESHLQLDENGNMQFITKRNHNRINRFNAYMLQVWRANMDIAAVVSKENLIAYLAKYITKNETSSEDFNNLLHIIYESSNRNDSAKRLIQRLLIKMSTERNFSAQEVAHNIMGLKYYSSSRTYSHIYFNALKNKTVVYNTSTQINIFEKYQSRKELKKTSLYQAVKNYELPSGKPLKKPSIVLMYPYLKHTLNMDDNHDYYKYNVILHVPHKKIEDLEKDFISWKYLYDHHALSTINLHDTSLQEDIRNAQENITEDDEEQSEENDSGLVREEYMEVLAMGPEQITDEIDLGRRDIDIQNNWNEPLQRYMQYGTKEEIETFISRMKANENNVIQPEQEPSSDNLTLTLEQQSVMNICNMQIQQLSNSNNLLSNSKIPRKIIVQGKAGTGKSVLIRQITSAVKTEHGNDSILLMAPTGIAAINIDGSTIHSKLRIFPNQPFAPLKGEAARKFEIQMEKVKFIIIDEYSMIASKMLYYIHKRCQEGKKNFQDDFGGLVIYLFGDIRQLAPAVEMPIYYDNHSSIEGKQGQDLFLNFDKIIELQNVMRQSDETFLGLLDRISKSNLSDEDYDLLATRFRKNIPSYERKEYDSVIHLFSNNESVASHNKHMLKTFKKPNTENELEPVARIPAVHNCIQAKSATDEEAKGLEPCIYLCKGATIMLTNNIWTEKGLVNGAIGTVVDILYDEQKSSPDDAPFAVICKFNTYKGPYLDDETKTVPIASIHRSWKNKSNIDCTRKQFPLKLAFAITIHKSQGLTLEKVVIDIGKTEFSAGLTYVALSRCKKFNNIMIEYVSPLRLLQVHKSSRNKQRNTFWNNLCFQKV